MDNKKVRKYSKAKTLIEVILWVLRGNKRDNIYIELERTKKKLEDRIIKSIEEK